MADSDEFFYLDQNGRKRDADLFKEILDDDAPMPPLSQARLLEFAAEHGISPEDRRLWGV